MQPPGCSSAQVLTVLVDMAGFTLPRFPTSAMAESLSSIRRWITRGAFSRNQNSDGSQ